MHPFLFGVILANLGNSFFIIYMILRQWTVVLQAEDEPSELKIDGTNEESERIFKKLRLLVLTIIRNRLYHSLFNVITIASLGFYHPAKRWNWVTSRVSRPSMQPVMYVAVETLMRDVFVFPFQLMEDSVNPVTTNIVIFVLTTLIQTILNGSLTYFTTYTLEVLGPNVFLWYCVYWLVTVSILTPVRTLMLSSDDEVVPLQAGSLRNKILTLATTVGFPITSIYITRGGHPTFEGPGAYFIGLLGTQAIVITASLILILTEEEVVAVVAHEMGHWKLGHTAKTVITRGVLSLCLGFYMWVLYDSAIIYDAFQIESRHPGMGLILLTTYVVPPVERIFNISKTRVMRENEFSADQFAKQMGFGRYLKTALIKTYWKAKIYPLADEQYSNYFISHPSIFERVRALQ